MREFNKKKNYKIVLTQEQIETAMNMALDGKPIVSILEAICLDSRSFWEYKQQDPLFQNDFEQARLEGLEMLADQLITIVDEYQDVQKARAKSDNYKWLLSKRKPQIYGDKIDVNVNQTVDIGGALKEARQRAIEKSSTKEIIGNDPVLLPEYKKLKD